MRLTITITVQFGDGPESAVFRSDYVAPEAIYSTLAVAEQSVRGTVISAHAGRARMREYLGPALVKEEDLLAA